MKADAVIEFEYILRKRGANRSRTAKWLAQRLGVCENTARKIINDPAKLTVRDIRLLNLTDDEILRVIKV